MRCAALTSLSPRRRRTTSRARHCSTRSTSRSASKRQARPMAKSNMIEREKKRAALAARYAKKRASLKETISSVTASDEEKEKAVIALHKFPRDSSKSRQLNPFSLTVRSRGVYKQFGLGRHTLDRKSVLCGKSV